MNETFHDGYYFKEDSLDKVMAALSGHYPRFDRKKFKELLDDTEWKGLYIMKRIRRVSICLHEVMPESFDETVGIFIKAAPHVGWWESMIFPDYIGMYGQDYWELSMSALTELTQRCSSEFGIRPFLINQPEKTAAYLEKLTDHENEDVRRFASEGCRPSHPWGIGLPLFKKDPSYILPILEKLKDDESEFVRRSVANNLNAISKDNPETVLDIAERWCGKTPETDDLVKHACRTLLKRGNRRALELFGFGSTEDLEVSDFHLDRESINAGDRMSFSFSLDVISDKEIPVRIEFAIHYLLANGSFSRKVYKIREKLHQPGTYRITKRTCHFIDRSTRKIYGGPQAISVIVNGEEMGKQEFILVK